MSGDFVKKQYKSQINEAERTKLPSIYSDPNSVDTWLHIRKYETLQPLIVSHPLCTWLTIGDGRYGSDAYYLNSQGVKATPSNITGGKLKAALKRGYISSYRIENAENLKCETGEFDFVLCKESYHHFARPPIALYEMLRVAGKGLVLIEPIDGNKRLFDFFRGSKIKKIVRGDDTALFEKSGNFIYRIDIKEIRKLLVAINATMIAVKYHNSFFHPKLSEQRFNDSFGSIVTRSVIAIQDVLCHLNILSYGSATIIIFMEIVEEFTVNVLRDHNYKIINLPKNPYMNEGS